DEKREDDKESKNVAKPQDSLFSFISKHKDGFSKEEFAEIKAEVEEIAQFCKRNPSRTPSKSQWSRLRLWARQAKISRESLIQLVGGTTKSSLSKGWEIPYKNQTLGDYLVSLVQNDKKDGLFLSEIAH